MNKKSAHSTDSSEPALVIGAPHGFDEKGLRRALVDSSSSQSVSRASDSLSSGLRRRAVIERQQQFWRRPSNPVKLRHMPLPRARLSQLDDPGELDELSPLDTSSLISDFFSEESSKVEKAPVSHVTNYQGYPKQFALYVNVSSTYCEHSYTVGL